jgi:large subunit ribosomal protein L23
MNQERLYKVIISPYTTEKSVTMADKLKQITFKVAKCATKIEVKIAVEKLFKVAVDSVRIVNVKGKVKRFRQQLGMKQGFRKAIVALKEGHDINWAEFE